MSKKECCEWTSEATDDSLKSMFQADEAYANGNVVKAVAYMKAQRSDRLPLINEKAVKECSTRPLIPLKDLQKELGKVEVMMEKQLPYQEVHAEVMRVDKKFALPGYRAFCGCSRR
jgi:hypothetical protein